MDAIIIIVVCSFIYFIPTICANYLGHKNTIAIFLLNLLAGWTLIGWIGSIVWAFMEGQEKR